MDLLWASVDDRINICCVHWIEFYDNWSCAVQKISMTNFYHSFLYSWYNWIKRLNFVFITIKYIINYSYTRFTIPIWPYTFRRFTDMIAFFGEVSPPQLEASSGVVVCHDKYNVHMTYQNPEETPYSEGEKLLSITQ